MDDLLTIPPPLLHQQVVTRLRNLLVQGEIAPGAKLNERALCEQLAISRTPLREAIKTLAAEGLIVLLPNRGAIAVMLTEQDARDTFDVIATLEARSGALAAQRITEAELVEIRALHYEMLAHHARRNLQGYYHLNALIHERINLAAKNPVLTQTYRAVNARLQALRFRSNVDEEKWDSAVRDHEEMLRALTARDGDALSAVLISHLETKRDVVLAQMRAIETVEEENHGA